MKVPVSKKLKEILQDPAARNQLQKALVGEGDGTITVNGKSYTLDKNAFYWHHPQEVLKNVLSKS